MASLRSLRSQKKQTRLQFSPLSSSSPLKANYSKEIQAKLANVRYASSENQLRRQDHDATGFDTLPTPESCSKLQVLPAVQDRDSSPLRDPPASDSSSKRRSSTEKEEDDIILPSNKRRRHRAKLDSEDTPRRSTRLQGKSIPSKQGSFSSASSERLIAVEIPNPVTRISEFGSAETTGDENNFTSTKTRPTKQPQRVAEDNFVVDDDQIEYVSGDEDISPLKQRKRHLPAARDDFIVDDSRVDYLSTDDDPVTPSKSQRLSRIHKSPRTVRQRTRRKKQELEEDLQDLQDSDSVVKQTRTRGAPVNKEREKTRKHLEILKRRRAGEKIPSLTDSEGERELGDIRSSARDASTYVSAGYGASVTRSEDKDITTFEEPEIDEDEDDFIVDDISTLRHDLPHPDIPIEFTSHASAKPRDLFIHIIEWLCKNKISPAFSRHDQIWSLAFNKIDDEVKAQAGSRLISSAWNAPFRRTLEARPNVKILRLPGLEEEYIRTCDACNRTNHPAQYDFVFEGKAYHQKTLEPVEEDEDEDDDDSQGNHNASIDSKGHVLPPQSEHFYLGRYCAANAEMGHKLTHWLFHLNQNLLARLTEQGVLSAEEIVKRDRMNHTKREKVAEALVDGMREAGVIDELWKDFKNDVDDARIGMDGHEKRGGRSVGRIGGIRAQREDGGIEDIGERRFREAPKTAEDSD